MKGKPRHEDNPFFKAKKETRFILRKSIKTINNSNSVNENNIRMGANFRDPNTFNLVRAFACAVTELNVHY